MRIVCFSKSGGAGLAAQMPNGDLRGKALGELAAPIESADFTALDKRALDDLYADLLRSPLIDEAEINYLPPVGRANKIICAGLNYLAHAVESPFAVPVYPTVFPRFRTSISGHLEPLVHPATSSQFDYEGEMAVIIGKPGRRINRSEALRHVLGYSIFNDGTVRDYAGRTTQWTLGKNFDATASFGPALVTADELPEGGKSLQLTTRLNGTVMQRDSTSSMIFDVATLIESVSEAIALAAGDVIVTGTPSGVGIARTPPIFMRAGDICEVEIEGLGILKNYIVDEARAK